jgi:hypothetical protein
MDLLLTKLGLSSYVMEDLDPERNRTSNNQFSQLKSDV